MAGEGDAAAQSEDEILSEALETFESGTGTAAQTGATPAAGPQDSEAGAATSGGKAGQQAGSRSAGSRGGTQAAGGRLGATGSASAGSQAGSAGGGGYRTSSERVAELDRELEGQMGTFDGMLLEERAQILAAQQTGDDAGGEDETRGAGGAGEEGDGGGDGDLNSAGNEDGDGAPPLLTRGGAGGGGGLPDARGGGRKGDYEQVAMGGPVPQDIPSADGDDVVARQLREAAMREIDPVLREKLWNEYRRYKGLPVKE
jgi:hypothetical protein